ncbi:hypothetical protein [Bacillus seohaeanensis]|jgi:hypothetical protein|uniref:Endolytic transglycosylase MltG n=1 Tax=Bacillus seohaeanensis TaxID=284580 RepID=A0ABW5RPS8_9BACI
MTPNSLRSFAVGLLVAATLTGAVYFSDSSKAKSTEKSAETVKSEKLTEDELIKKLESKGFVIQTEDEWNQQIAAVNEKTEEKAEKKADKKSDEKVIYRTILTVSSGMTSIDVGNALERGKVIDSGMEFYKEVEKRGLENDLRPGTFEIESGMKMDEVISIIFK